MERPVVQFRQSSSSQLSRVLVFLCAAATVGLLVTAGCVRSDKNTPSLSSAELAALAKTKPEFIGNDACAECHAAAFESHKNSRHALTLRDMTPQALGSHAPPEGAIPETQMALRLVNGVYSCVRIGFEDKTLPLNLAIGSGKTGITFIGLLNSDTLYETRMSYFPHAKTWHATPGQGILKPGAPGKLAQGAEARQCIQCHAVTLPANSLQPEPKFYGVGCESCHGAGSVHVKAARAGQPKLGMERLADWNATRLNELCAKCHRGPTTIKNAKITEGMTARFQPFGLMRSKCFQKSGDTLSCSTCHKPHEDATQPIATYEAACLNCHGGNRGQQTENRTPNAPMTQRPNHLKSCPVNPKSGCITCHMPMRDVFPGQNVPTQMPDHQIAIHRK